MDTLNKKYYKISEVADIVDLPASTLRYWEKRFTIIKPHRNDHGTRFYTPADIEKIRMVAYLVKHKGMHLEAAQEQIARNHSGLSKKTEALERLHSIRHRLQELVDAIDSRKR